jgi:hypothetical protein
LKNVRFDLQDDEWFEEYGMRKAIPNLWAPDYLDLRRPGSFPIIYSAYGVMEVEGGKIGILTEQIAIDKNGSFVLFNLYDSPEFIQYVVTYGRRNFDNAKTYFTPIVELKEERCKNFVIPKHMKQFCEKWTASFVSTIIRDTVKKWVDGGGLDPKLIERLLMWAGPISY